MSSPSTVRQTSGAGFAFEDLVAAWLLSKSLAGDDLPGLGSRCHTIQFQTGALGWEIDDLLLTAGAGSAKRCLAVSCKSSVQVSQNGLPQDFVDRAWTQWRASGGPMRRYNDTLALVTRGYHEQFSPQWSDIASWARGSDNALAIARIRDIKRHSRIFDSVRFRNGEAAESDDETLELIRHLQVIPLDFQLEASNSFAEAAGKCRQLLESGDPLEAKELWATLVGMAGDTRLGPGTLLLDEVWAKLRSSYRLKDRPDFEQAWALLRRLTRENKEIIETNLPSGLSLDRADETQSILRSIELNNVTVVLGSSGSGKSALVKRVLDGPLSNAQQIWLGPEQAHAALSEHHRSQTQLRYPLAEVFNSTSATSNILIIDAAERLHPDATLRLRNLLDQILPLELRGKPLWKVVIVGQTDGMRDRLRNLQGRHKHQSHVVEDVSIADVKSALRGSEKLHWLANRREEISALRNLKVLSWVMQSFHQIDEAGAEFGSSAAVADKVWEIWTDRKVARHKLLVALALREAEFERTVPLSELEAGQADVLDEAPSSFPIRRNNLNRVEFRHDLVADWARYQKVKESAETPEAWAPLADNPLWTSALRLLGQFLLRQKHGSVCAWDHAFDALDAQGRTLAADVLLDALCLDPNARQFLEERVERLLANNGSLLSRLLSRFLYIATIPKFPEEIANIDRPLVRYIEDRFRLPIFGLWAPVAHFLNTHRQRIAEFISPIVADVCAVWLSMTPPLLRGAVTPYRVEFAKLALATARHLQVDLEAGTLYLEESSSRIYSAAMAAGQECSEEVAQWALELSKRRPVSEWVATKANLLRAARNAEYARSIAGRNRASTSGQKAARDRAKASLTFSRGRRLPPWPMGPTDWIERHFRSVILHSQSLAALMSTRPGDAAEILLAAIVEAKPIDSEDDAYTHDKLGLQHDSGDSSPTAYWKSPFFTFLEINTEIALSTLMRLVEFATERWSRAWSSRHGSDVPHVTLKLSNGATRSYVGNLEIFDWTQSNSNGAGQLHCALDALERWLTLKLEQGSDVETVLQKVLTQGNSLALIGTLVNIAKYRPSLLSGTLRPLITSPDVYWLDASRVDNNSQHFDAFSWARMGEQVFNFSKQWIFAPHRKTTLLQTIVSKLRDDPLLSEYVTSTVGMWEAPEAPKSALEFKILAAQLDVTNYRTVADSERSEFVCPAALAKEITDYQSAIATEQSKLVLSHHCEAVLQGRAKLSDEAPATLLEALVESDDLDADDAELHERNRIAAAATLVVAAKEWLEQRRKAKDTTEIILRQFSERLASADSSSYRTLEFGAHFAAYGVFDRWLQSNGAGRAWDRPLLQILTSGSYSVARVIGRLAYMHRVELGSRWWRLLRLATLWSALSMLRRQYVDDEFYSALWRRRIEWLRSRDMTGLGEQTVEFHETWTRLVRIERRRWHRQKFIGEQTHFGDAPRSHGLSANFLASFYDWLLADTARPTGAELEFSQPILIALWTYEAAVSSSDRDSHGDYRLPSQLGYDLLKKLAYYSAHAPNAQAKRIWSSVLCRGPAARHFVEHFVSNWFMQITRGCDPRTFTERWAAMLEFVIEGHWVKEGYWFNEQLLKRQMLGFGSEVFLKALDNAAAAVGMMRELYHRWAMEDLHKDEDNIFSFSHFLESEVGREIRLDGIRWLADVLGGAPKDDFWRRGGDTAESLVSLLDAAIHRDATRLRNDPTARDALMRLAAHLVAKQATGALGVQERIKSLR